MPHTLHADVVSSEDLSQVQNLVESLPPGSPLAVLLHNIISAASRGLDVTVLSSDRDLTPNQTADMLGMSRPHLLKLLDTGIIGFHRVGSHRRIHLTEVLDFIDRRERAGASVAQALGTREHDLAAIRDAAGEFTDEELRELGMTS